MKFFKALIYSFYHSGHSATQGCSKCKKSFPGGIGEKCYGGFDREHWVMRTHEEHKQQMQEIMGSTSKGDRDQLQSKYGTRYSVLIELPYFSPVRMAIVDPMHNLFLGTAKHMLNIWKAQKIIDEKRFEQIDQRLQHIEAASDIGKLPTKLVGNYGTFTADELKNWVLLFSIYALKGIIHEDHLKCWRNFVLACRYLCSRLITKNDIKIADNLLLKFCKSFEQLYGPNAVTPNIHLHCHLRECLLDYGPVYSFWLFSFERYNGILGQLPSNKRLIEKQLMQRFIRDSFLYDADFPELYQDQLLDKVNILLDPKDRGSLSQIGYETLHQTLHLASRNLDPKDGQWCNLGHVTYNPCPKPKSLTTFELHNITTMYKVLYPNSSIHPHVSYSTIKHVYLGQELYGSINSRSRRSSNVMAFWAGKDGAVQTTMNMYIKPRPGTVEFFMLHVAIIDEVPLQHLLAKVMWNSEIASHKEYFGNPVEVWYAKLFDIEGPATYVPVQRIKCKFARIEQHMFGKDVLITCPRERAMNA